MSDARFNPPTAAVADVPVEPPPRPVVIACWLLGISLLLGFVSVGVDVRSVPTETRFIVLGLVVMLPIFALFAWLIIMLWRRRNWARWATLAFMVLGWLMLLLDDGIAEGRLPTLLLLDGLTVVAEAMAMGLVFFGPGARWFKERPPEVDRAHSAAS